MLSETLKMTKIKATELINSEDHQMKAANKICKESPILPSKPLLLFYKPWADWYCNLQYRAYFNILLSPHIYSTAGRTGLYLNIVEVFPL